MVEKPTHGDADVTPNHFRRSLRTLARCSGKNSNESVKPLRSGMASGNPAQYGGDNMILSIENRGTIENPRFLLMNSFGWFFDEEADEFVETGGTLYHQVNDATTKMREILLAEHGDKPVRRFRAPVYLDLYAIEEIPQNQVEDWALRATRLILHPDQGLGPGGGKNLGLVSIDWSKLEELS